MYLLLFFIFISAALFFLIFNLFKISNNISVQKDLYIAKSGDNKYFLLFLLLSVFKPFEFYLKKIKIKSYVGYAEKLNKILKVQKYPFTAFNPYNFIMFQFFSMFAAVILTALLITPDTVVVTASAVLFFVLPYVKIYEQNKKIITAVIRQLPDISDLLAVLISSGIDFNNAIIKISILTKGILSEELSDVMSKVSLGVDIKTALNEMAQKYDIEQLNLFVRTINSALDSGLGMSEALNTISNQLKNEYVSYVEKKAHEAPVKMLIPMTLLILPVIFILLFAPMVLSYLKNGSLF